MRLLATVLLALMATAEAKPFADWGRINRRGDATPAPTEDVPAPTAGAEYSAAGVEDSTGADVSTAGADHSTGADDATDGAPAPTEDSPAPTAGAEDSAAGVEDSTGADDSTAGADDATGAEDATDAPTEWRSILEDCSIPMFHSSKIEGKTGRFNNLYELSVECGKGEETVISKLDLNECISTRDGKLGWNVKCVYTFPYPQSKFIYEGPRPSHSFLIRPSHYFFDLRTLLEQLANSLSPGIEAASQGAALTARCAAGKKSRCLPAHATRMTRP